MKDIQCAVAHTLKSTAFIYAGGTDLKEDAQIGQILIIKGASSNRCMTNIEYTDSSEQLQVHSCSKWHKLSPAICMGYHLKQVNGKPIEAASSFSPTRKTVMFVHRTSTVVVT